MATGTQPDQDREWGPLALVAVPLRREPVVRFLRAWHVPPRGASVLAVEQRPPSHRRAAWLEGLTATSSGTPGLTQRLLATDATDAHLAPTTTDRLVPRHLLDGDDTFLERNLGGWSPLWFGVLATAGDVDDPVLAAREVLVEYGETVTDLAAAPELVTERLATELGGPSAVVNGAVELARLRTEPVSDRVAALVAAANGDAATTLPRLLALDELLETLYRVELERRDAIAEDRGPRAEELAALQARLSELHGVRLLLKGEYVMGRHRRSTVLLAEGLDVVVKQPAPEPDHDVALAARSHDGSDENWPVALDGGRVMTSRGVIGRVVEDGAIERVNAVFDRDVEFSVALGLSVEPFAVGPTLAELAVGRPDELTQQHYDEVLVHQLVCEQLGVDNPDWHAANFMVTGDGLVHVDWGAARPVPAGEEGPRHAKERLDQVAELAWSFQDAGLAARTTELHERATQDPDHLEQLRVRARDVVAGS